MNIVDKLEMNKNSFVCLVFTGLLLGVATALVIPPGKSTSYLAYLGEKHHRYLFKYTHIFLTAK